MLVFISTTIYVISVTKIWRKYSILKFILFSLSLCTSILNSIICLFESLLYHDLQMKIISNNMKINSFLKNEKTKIFELVDLKMLIVIFVIHITFAIPVYITLSVNLNPALLWGYYLIFVSDWVIIKYGGEMFLNIENFKFMNKKLKCMHGSDDFSLVELEEIMVFLDKLYENISITKCIMLHPVSEIMI